MTIGYGPKIDYRFCNGCKKCYDICPSDVFDWDDEKSLPIVAYPDECYYCAGCELECLEEAISIKLPLHAMLDIGIYPEV